MFVGGEDGSIGQCGGKPDAQRGELPGAANIANTGYRLSQWLISSRCDCAPPLASVLDQLSFILRSWLGTLPWRFLRRRYIITMILARCRGIFRSNIIIPRPYAAEQQSTNTAEQLLGATLQDLL